MPARHVSYADEVVGQVLWSQSMQRSDESLSGHCTDERRVRKRDKKVRRDEIYDDSRRWRERGQQ